MPQTTDGPEISKELRERIVREELSSGDLSRFLREAETSPMDLLLQGQQGLVEVFGEKQPLDGLQEALATTLRAVEREIGITGTEKQPQDRFRPQRRGLVSALREIVRAKETLGIAIANVPLDDEARSAADQLEIVHAVLDVLTDSRGRVDVRAWLLERTVHNAYLRASKVLNPLLADRPELQRHFPGYLAYRDERVEKAAETRTLKASSKAAAEEKVRDRVRSEELGKLAEEVGKRLVGSFAGRLAAERRKEEREGGP